MPAEYQYDPDARLLRVRYHGVVTDEDVLGSARAMARDERIGPDACELVDASDLERADISPHVILTVIAFKCDHHEKFRRRRVAVVAPGASLSAMVRLYQRAAKLAGLAPQVRGFETLAGARAWLEGSRIRAAVG